MTKILIIEDHVDMRYLLEWQVELMGFVALSVENGAEGVKIAIAEKPDLILMDIMCPISTAWKLRERCAPTPKLAVFQFWWQALCLATRILKLVWKPVVPNLSQNRLLFMNFR